MARFRTFQKVSMARFRTLLGFFRARFTIFQGVSKSKFRTLQRFFIFPDISGSFQGKI